MSNPGLSMPGAATPVPAASQAQGQGTQQGFKTSVCPSTGQRDRIPPVWNEGWGDQCDNAGPEDGGPTISVPSLGCRVQLLSLTKVGTGLSESPSPGKSRGSHHCSFISESTGKIPIFHH